MRIRPLLTDVTLLATAAVLVLTAASSIAAAATDEIPPLLTPEEREQLLWQAKPRPDRGRLPDQRQLAAVAAQEDFDVTHYFLDLDFDDVGRSLSGSVTMTATSLVDGLQQVLLDLHDNMTITGVARGATPLAYSHASDLLDITLDQPFGVGQSFQVQISYNGSPQGGGFGTFGWNKYSGSGDGEMVWSLSEPEGARNWWPCKDRPDDKALVEMWWTVKSAWTATGNGQLIGMQPAPGNRTQYRWQASHPLTTYLVSVAATDYAKFSDTYTPLGGGTMPIDYYVYSEDLADAQVSFSEMPAMIEFFAQLWGEYPFVVDKYGMSAFPFSGAMEHTTNTSYGYALMNGAHTYDWILVHELAHQWCGDSVSPETWKDIWLNEGHATYAEALWSEHLGGHAALKQYMERLRSPYYEGPLYDPVSLFGGTSYNKGGWIQHMLRGVVGDTAFFQAQRDWYLGRADGVGNTAQYQATLEARHGSSLDWFFQPWVYGENMPDYEYGFSTVDAGGGIYRTYVNIRQVQLDAGVFSMPVDLTLVTTSGDEIHTVWNDSASQDFVLETTAPVTDVLFDDALWILKVDAIVTALSDGDSDGVPDQFDNCTATSNPGQSDIDADTQGDACDDDDDGDLLVDGLDCAPSDSDQGEPGPVSELTVQRPQGQPARLDWSLAERTDTYDVIRGLLDGLAGGPGSCHATGVTDLFFVDGDVLPPAAGFGYLVRGRDSGCGGAGTLGDATAGPRIDPCP